MTYAAPPGLLANAPIGVFDSGIGGLSILKALRAEMPGESFVYYADSAHNPYGDKSDAFITGRSRAITQQLIAEHAIKALVVACNTATAAAISALRAEHPGLPIIGIEPALKPAVAISQSQRIAVLATRGTLSSAKFLALKASLSTQAEFICTPCDGLADAIERIVDDPDHIGTTQNTTKLIANYLISTSENYRFGHLKDNIDTLVLGCTHYPLLLAEFRKQVGSSVHIVDNGQAVARRVAQCITAAQPGQRGGITLLSSGAQHHLAQAAKRWLGP
jgi:glutamate racemase